MHLAFSIVSFHRCMRACDLCPESCVFGEGLRQLPLAGIALERTHGPEGVGRVYPYGLGGFLHFGLDVRVDLRGRGCQLCACHGSAPRRMLLPAQPRIAFPPLGVGTGRLIHRPTAAETNASARLTGAVPRRRGRARFPAASRGSSDALTEHRFLVSRNPPSLIEKSWIGASLRFARRHDYTSTAPPTGFTMRLYNRGQIFGF